MAIGSIINLGGGGGSLGGKGMIIVDTATMTAGDVVRVRDVFDSQNVQNKSVVTTGTPLYFEVNPYCYYKACMVQDINDTPTEIGGMYTTIDVGQTVYVNVLDKTTLGGIQGILNAHQETSLLNIGDEVDIKVNGSPETFVLAHLNAYASHSAIFCKKQATGSLNNSTAYYRTGGQKAWCESYYNTIAEKDKQFIKQKTVSAAYAGSVDNTTDNYVWSPTAYECGYYDSSINSGEANNPNNTKFDLFATAQGRTRNIWWWTATHWGGGSYYSYVAVDTNGVFQNGSSGIAMLPCFMLTADS